MRAISDVGTAVVGTGFIGVVHVEALRRLGVNVVGVVGSSPERASAKAGEYPLPRVYESFDQALADPAVDVVHVATPNRLHYPQVKESLAAGKHVICEKPLAMTAAQSAELLELAERSGLVHCTNFNLRYYPQVQEARYMLQLLEDMTLCAESEITISSDPLAVMIAVIREKLAFKPRLVPVDAAGFLQDR